MLRFAVISITLFFLLSASSAAGAPLVKIRVEPDAEIVADGQTPVTLTIHFDAQDKTVGPKVVVRVRRGKVLEATPVQHNRATVTLRLPRVTKPRRLGLTINTHIGRRRINRKVAIGVVPPSSQADPVARPAELPSPPDLPSGFTALALMPIAGVDVTDEIVHDIEDSLARGVDSMQGYRSVTSRDVLADIRDLGLPGDCLGDLPCLARAGRYARSHITVETRIAAIGGTLRLSMRTIDTEEAKELGRVTESIADDATARDKQLRTLLVKLLEPDRYVGALTIECAQDGAQVFLDDRPIGQTPLKPRTLTLTAGPHILQVSKPGFTDLYRFVEVVYARSSEISVDLDSNTVEATLVSEAPPITYGTLYVASDLESLEIFVDGTALPDRQQTERLVTGDHSLSLIVTGASPIDANIQITEGKRTEVSVTQIDGALVITETRVVDPQAPLMAALPPHDGRSTQTNAAPRWRWIGGVALIGGGVLALGGGAWQRVAASSTSKSIDDVATQASSPNLSYAEYVGLEQERRDLNEKGQKQTRWSVALLAGGTLLAATGSALLVWHQMDRVELDVTTGSGSAGVRATVRW